MTQAIGAANGSFLLGFLMDKIGRKQGLFLVYLAGGISVMLFGMAASDTSLYIAGATTGLFVLSAPTALLVVSGETYPTHIRSTGIGWAQAAGRVGSILGPFLGGLLQTTGVSLGYFFIIFSLPCFVCMLIILFLRADGKGDALEKISARLLSAD